MSVLQAIRSLIFTIAMYMVMLIMAIVFLIPMLIHKRYAMAACNLYARYVIWSAQRLLNLKLEVRGTPPKNSALVAAKHQSFFDILVIFSLLERPQFIMKHILLYAPIFGQYTYRIGCIPVKRGKRAQAIKKMLADVENNKTAAGQLVIFPQGTRVPPGEKRQYKIGTGVLYREMGCPCTPVATNIGLFWPKRGIYRWPGTAVVEFLPAIQPNLPIRDFMKKLEHDIETHSDALITQAKHLKN